MPIDLLLRSKRKTVALIIEHDGRLIVRAPLRLSLKRIEAMVAEKAAWIEQKQEQVRAAHPKLPQFAAGEAFWYLGKRCPLEIVPASTPLVWSGGRFHLSQAVQSKAREVFTRWYKNQARSLITARVEAFAGQHGFVYQNIRVSSARTRWGSCSAKGTLSFTWRLVMAPLEVIDYVVVHELAHLKQPNHSTRFWELVQAILPDYKTRRQWLKTNGRGLNLD